MDTIEKMIENCTGCEACVQICKANAIAMEQDDEGFFYPHIDVNKCVGCGSCYENCGINLKKKVFYSLPDKFYVGTHFNNDILLNSSSGGAFSAIVEEFRPDVIFGMAWNGTSVECIASNIDRLSEIRKSKYVQARINGAYLRIKEELKRGKCVVFGGTACQISGLLSVVGDERERLLTVEVVCHGVASPGLFKKYCDEKSEKRKAKIEHFDFRKKSKKKGDWEWFNTCIGFSNGKKEYSYRDVFTTFFLERYSLRKSCGNCVFAKDERMADILIGDFWGCKEYSREIYNSYGVSFVAPISDKGCEICDSIKTMDLRKVDAEIVKARNSSLYCSTPLACNRTSFFEKAKISSFSDLEGIYLSDRMFRKRIKYFLHSIGIIR